MVKENRRKFLKKAGTLLTAGLALPVLGNFVTSCDSNEGPLINSNNSLIISVADYPELAELGAFVKVRSNDFNNGRAVIVVKVETSTYKTFSSVCTHQGCEVNLPVNDKFICDCHGSAFSVQDGSVLQKPFDGASIAPLPILKNQFNIEKGILTIFI